MTPTVLANGTAIATRWRIATFDPSTQRRGRGEGTGEQGRAPREFYDNEFVTLGSVDRLLPHLAGSRLPEYPWSGTSQRSAYYLLALKLTMGA